MMNLRIVIKINRKFLGIEMDENYFNIGVKRMSDAIQINNSV